MKKLLATLLIGLCASVCAQTYPPIAVTGYINEQGNLFAMSHTPDGHTPFHIQMQTLVFQPPMGDVMSSITINATGQNGPGYRVTYSTLFPWLADASGAQYPAVWLMTSAPAFNADGTPILVPDLRYSYANCAASPPIGCIQRYDDVAPAVDGGGNPIVFTPIVSATGTITGWHLYNVSPVDLNGVPLYATLAAGYYNLHEVGTSSPIGLSTLFTRSTASYYIPPPPPPPTDE